VPIWLGDKLHMRRLLRKSLGHTPKNRFVFPEHHESHAASAFFPSPFEEAAILTMDGVGEWATTSLGIGEGNRLKLLKEIRFPHSLGLLYSAFTYYCGFKVNSGEYKLMGLAPYGEPRFEKRIREHLIDLKRRRQLPARPVATSTTAQGLTMTGRSSTRCSAARRAPESQLEQRHMDLAASIQKVTEDVMLRTARHAHALTGKKNLCLAGGVALNCVGNGVILREGPFEKIWIQPAAGDAGGALGAALFTWHNLLGKPRRRGPATPARQPARPALRIADIKAFLDSRARRLRGVRQRGEARRPRQRADRTGERDRLVPGPDGVRPARARRAQHPRRRALAEDAERDEPEDQVPRVVPAVRADRAARTRERVLRHRAAARQPVHADRGAGARGEAQAGRRPAPPASTS
jgi:carbamoyltransferase